MDFRRKGDREMKKRKKKQALEIRFVENRIHTYKLTIGKLNDKIFAEEPLKIDESLIKCKIEKLSILIEIEQLRLEELQKWLIK